MFWKLFCLFLFLIIVILISRDVYNKCCDDKKCYDGHDIHNAQKAIYDLKKMKDSGHEPKEISKEELKKLDHRIHIAGLEMEDRDKLEGYDDFAFPRYPPATLKALYEAGIPIKGVKTDWPPGMYNRLQYTFSNFYTSGLSWWLRPMAKYGNSSFWVKSNGSYYYIRN